jgi:hypothetical protein
MVAPECESAWSDVGPGSENGAVGTDVSGVASASAAPETSRADFRAAWGVVAVLGIVIAASLALASGSAHDCRSRTGSTAGRNIDDLRQPAVEASIAIETGIRSARLLWRPHAIALPLQKQKREIASALSSAR